MTLPPLSGHARLSFIVSILSLLPIVHVCAAEDGKTNYNTYCSACHGTDGKGANDGAFPPLAGSAWVKGNADRAIQIVLHGLEGPIEVPTPGKPDAAYNLVMPPQGDALTDPQIASIITYIRSSWGNKEKAVEAKEITKIRNESTSQLSMWNSAELLNKYPMRPPPAFTNLTMQVYHGEWKKLPDFDKLKPNGFEEEQGGLISLANINKKKHFGVVWEGDIDITSDANYTFRIDSDDGSAIYIDGKLLTKIDGIRAMKKPAAGKVSLKKGKHRVRVEYIQFQGKQGIAVSMRGGKLDGVVLLSDPNRKPPKATWPSIPIDAPKGGTAFYRGFIDQASPRAIGVGYDGGINLAFSGDTASIQLIWQDRFFDGGRHWTGRGQGDEPVPGKKVIKLNNLPAWGLLENPTAPWSTMSPSKNPAVKTRFRGYTLGDMDRPTFNYDIGELKVSDTPSPNFSTELGMSITRTINIEVPESGAPQNLHLLLCNGLTVNAASSANTYSVGKGLQITVDSKAANTALVRDKELILPLNLTPGTNQITVRYQWK